MKFIPCDENSQTFSWQGTNKRAKQLNLNLDKNKKYKNVGFKKIKKEENPE